MLRPDGACMSAAVELQKVSVNNETSEACKRMDHHERGPGTA